MTAYQRLLDAARDAGQQVRERGDRQASVQCPAHDDHAPSLSVTRIEQQVLIHCHAGCDTDDVLAALNLTRRDLFDEPRGARYDYTDVLGTVTRSVIRSPEKQFRQSGDTQGAPTLYRLPEVAAAVDQDGTIFLVEGEKDADALAAFGAVATTAPMGSSNFGKVDVTPLTGARVVAVVDQDEAGKRWADQVAATVGPIAASLTFKRAAHGKDAADHIAAGGSVDTLVDLEDAPEVEVAPGSSWGAVDLSDIVAGLQAGTLARHTPRIGLRDDGIGLFYAGKVNGVAGASGAGKSWTGLAVTAQLIAAEHVVYVDLEDDEAGIVGRLLDLHAAPEDILGRFHYVRPDEAFGGLSAGQLDALLTTYTPALVVIDSTGEALAINGAKPNDDDDVARWFRLLPARIARFGPAVVVLDHMTKADDGGLWPIGSQRKRAAISGAQYVQTTVKPFAKGAEGMAKLVCAKDRHGTHTAGERVADLVMGPDSAGGLHAVLRAPVEASAGAGKDWRPTGLMEHVSKALEAAGEPMSRRGIEESVRGKKEHVKIATEHLVEAGYVSVEVGPRSARLHTSVKPYRQREDPGSDLYQGRGDGHTANDPESVSDRPRPLRRGDGGRTVGPSPGDSRGTVGDGHESDPRCADCGARLGRAENGVCIRCSRVRAAS
ncbi:AAA family ATPase [Dermacoccaceae bacterium W4C1]